MSWRSRSIFAVTVSVLLFACAAPASSAAASAAAVTQIEFWTFPIGDFGNPDTVNDFMDRFMEANPDIRVSVDYLSYGNGDDQVSAAINADTAPDVIMEGPERLVTSWGSEGVMADLGDLWSAEATADINATSPVIAEACRSREGIYYEYPLCMTAHCMAINYQVFEQAGALADLDLENRTWTTDGFIDACRKIAASGLTETPGIVYCGGQGGDQGTRALVTNLYDASFTNADHTAYTINSEQGVKALQLLVEMTREGIFSYNASIVAADELKLFAAGKTAMTLAWNSSNEKNYAGQVDFTPYAMCFPSEDGNAQLAAGLWGFGIFDHQDEKRAEAARRLIRFLCDDSDQAAGSVRATGFFPVRSSLGNLYADTEEQERMNVYWRMMSSVGDYYSITPGWTAQRAAWWNMLQQVFNGADVQTAADQYAAIANRAAGK
jgi:multiple sugar transport system substrate-binding protein